MEELLSQTEMNMKILEEFTKAGLDFAFPTQTLYTKQLGQSPRRGRGT